MREEGRERGSYAGTPQGQKGLHAPWRQAGSPGEWTSNGSSTHLVTWQRFITNFRKSLELPCWFRCLSGKTVFQPFPIILKGSSLLLRSGCFKRQCSLLLLSEGEEIAVIVAVIVTVVVVTITCPKTLTYEQLSFISSLHMDQSCWILVPSNPGNNTDRETHAQKKPARLRMP